MLIIINILYNYIYIYIYIRCYQTNPTSPMNLDNLASVFLRTLSVQVTHKDKFKQDCEMHAEYRKSTRSLTLIMLPPECQ